MQCATISCCCCAHWAACLLPFRPTYSFLMNRGIRSAPLVATRLFSHLRVDQVDLTPAFLPISRALHDLVFRHDNGCPTPFAVRLSKTSPQLWIRLARVPGTACASIVESKGGQLAN